MSEYQRAAIYPIVLDLNRINRGVISSALLGDFLGISARAARYHLRKMELAGAVVRPTGQRRGWMASEYQHRRIQAGV